MVSQSGPSGAFLHFSACRLVSGPPPRAQRAIRLGRDRVLDMPLRSKDGPEEDHQAHEHRAQGDEPQGVDAIRGLFFLAVVQLLALDPLLAFLLVMLMMLLVVVQDGTSLASTS